MSAPVTEQPVGLQEFRRRLLEGLAACIEQRGYRDTTVADIVRHARTSKRTFYDLFDSKQQCFFDLLAANNAELIDTLRGAVDPAAPWREQVRQAVTAYVGTIEATPAITLSWIRELPALGEGARPLMRQSSGRLAEVIVELTTGPGFRRAGVAPLSMSAAVILVGGLRELTAQTVEDGQPVGGIIEPAVAVATALLAGRGSGTTG